MALVDLRLTDQMSTWDEFYAVVPYAPLPMRMEQIITTVLRVVVKLESGTTELSDPLLDRMLNRLRDQFPTLDPIGALTAGLVLLQICRESAKRDR